MICLADWDRALDTMSADDKDVTFDTLAESYDGELVAR